MDRTDATYGERQNTAHVLFIEISGMLPPLRQHYGIS